MKLKKKIKIELLEGEIKKNQLKRNKKNKPSQPRSICQTHNPGYEIRITS
jgi:hypothetical protein